MSEPGVWIRMSDNVEITCLCHLQREYYDDHHSLERLFYLDSDQISLRSDPPICCRLRRPGASGGAPNGRLSRAITCSARSACSRVVRVCSEKGGWECDELVTRGELRSNKSD